MEEMNRFFVNVHASSESCDDCDCHSCDGSCHCECGDCDWG